MHVMTCRLTPAQSIRPLTQFSATGGQLNDTETYYAKRCQTCGSLLYCTILELFTLWTHPLHKFIIGLFKNITNV